MSKKSGIVAFLVIILIVIGIVFLSRGGERLDETVVPSTQIFEEDTGIVEEEGENTILYTDSGFSPALLTVSVGDVVIFENRSSRSTWVASALHPTHRLYPVSGGCIGSTFDACEGISSGFSWSFTFNERGTWRYHDHLNARFTGTIVVE